MIKLMTNIEKIKILTESLVDRDFLRVKIINLFDKFCNDFPIPMNAWIVDKKLDIISKKGNFLDKNLKTASLNDIFDGDNKNKNIQMHKKALAGETVTYTMYVDNKMLLTRLIPSDNDGNLVFGVSMDVTSFLTLSDALDNYCDDIQSSECKILNKVKNDPLYKIIKNGDNNHE